MTIQKTINPAYIYTIRKKERFPHVTPVADPYMPFKVVPDHEWIAVGSSEGYCDGYLVKRISDVEVMMAPYWDRGYTYDREANCLKDTGQFEMAFDDSWYVIIHRDSLLLSNHLNDKVWENLEAGDFLELNLELYDHYQESTIPSRLSHVFQFMDNVPREEFISDEELEALYHKTYLRYRD